MQAVEEDVVPGDCGGEGDFVGEGDGGAGLGEGSAEGPDGGESAGDVED